MGRRASAHIHSTPVKTSVNISQKHANAAVINSFISQVSLRTLSYIHTRKNTEELYLQHKNETRAVQSTG